MRICRGQIVLTLHMWYGYVLGSVLRKLEVREYSETMLGRLEKIKAEGGLYEVEWFTEGVTKPEYYTEEEVIQFKTRYDLFQVNEHYQNVVQTIAGSEWIENLPKLTNT